MALKFPRQNTVILDQWSYLPIEWKGVKEIFVEEQTPDVIRDSTFGIHWFNGSAEAKTFQNDMHAGKLNTRGLIYKYLVDYL